MFETENDSPPPSPARHDATKEMVEETIVEQLALYDVLVVTDVPELEQHAVPGGGALASARARVAVVTDPADPLAADQLMLRWAQAGKAVVSWCSMTDHGRRVAREVAATLNPHLQATGNGSGRALRVRHIVKDPRDWQPLVDSFDMLVAGARGTVPAAPHAAAGGAVAVQDDDYDVSSLRSAERLLVAHSDRLLVVSDAQNALSDLYVLGGNGVWQRGDVVLRGWMGELADNLKVNAVVHDRMDGRALNAVLLRLRRLAEPATLEPIREQAATALHRLIDRGELRPGEVTTCLDTDLDADLRYLGTPTGVIDLCTGGLLSPADGRRHLVTWQTLVGFDPTATHPDVDRLFAHLPEELRTWWWRVLGFHLLGAPSRRFYVVEGPTGGGKSTLANALEAVLGPYATRPQDTALEAPRGSAGLSPEMEKLTSPRRFALFVELTIRKVSGPQMKRFCGDDAQTLRKPYKAEITVRLTATMLLFCNPGSVPHLRLQDDAMAGRLRVLPYPSIPAASRDPRFTRLVQTDDGFKRAFLARLVAAAAAEQPGVAPEEPPAVAAATVERVRDDVGELGAFSRRLMRDANSTLPFAEVWAAWCKDNEESTDAPEPGGISKRRLSGALRDFVPRLTAARQFRVGGDRVRGWRGWRLMTPEEAEQADATQQAEKTEPPADLKATQAVRDLLAGFPGDFSVFGCAIGHGQVPEILEALPAAEMLALRNVCKDGRELADQIQHLTEHTSYTNLSTGQVFDAENYLKDCLPDLDAEGRAQGHLRGAIAHLAWEAHYDQIGGPVLEEARRRQSDLTWEMGLIALGAVEAAVRRLGPDADAESVAREATERTIDRLSSMSEEERERYDPEEIEAAIEELVGAREAPYGIHERLRAGRGPVVHIGDQTPAEMK